MSGAASQEIKEQTTDVTDGTQDEDKLRDSSAGPVNGHPDTTMTQSHLVETRDTAPTPLAPDGDPHADHPPDGHNTDHTTKEANCCQDNEDSTNKRRASVRGAESEDDDRRGRATSHWEKVLKSEKRGKWYYYPSLSEHWNERQKYLAARSVLVGPVAPEDLQREDVTAIVANASQYAIKYHKYTGQGFRGTLELQYHRPQEARQAYDALVSLNLREDIIIRYLYPKDNKFVEATDIRVFGDPCNQFTEKIGDRTLALINICDTLTEDMIRQRFPHAVHVFIPHSFVTESRKGHAYVEFKSPQDMKEIVGSPVTIEGQEIRTAHLDIIPAPGIITARIDSELGRIRNQMATGGIMTEDDRHTLMNLKRNCIHYLDVDYIDDKLKSEIAKRILPLRTTLGQERRPSRDKRYSKQATLKRPPSMMLPEPLNKRGRFPAGQGGHFPPADRMFNAGGGQFTAGSGPFNAGDRMGPGPMGVGPGALNGGPGLMGNAPVGNGNMGNLEHSSANMTANILMGLSNMIRHQSNLAGNLGNIAGAGMGNPPPGMGNGPRVMGNGPPVMGNGQPVMGNPPPGMGNQPPVMGNGPPGMGNPPLGLGNHPPSMGNPPPGMGNPPPGMGNPPRVMGNINRNTPNNLGTNFSNLPRTNANFGNQLASNQGFQQQRHFANQQGRNFHSQRGGRW